MIFWIRGGGSRLSRSRGGLWRMQARVPDLDAKFFQRSRFGKLRFKEYIPQFVPSSWASDQRVGGRKGADDQGGGRGGAAPCAVGRAGVGLSAAKGGGDPALGAPRRASRPLPPLHRLRALCEGKEF